MINGIITSEIDKFKSFILLCASFTIVTIFIIFFGEDLLRIFTPFLVPFIWLFMFLGYLALTILSLVYIPTKIKKVSWRVFLPVIINFATFLIVYYFFAPLNNLRNEIGFRIREDKFNEAVVWVTKSVQIGEIDLEKTKGTVILPNEYQNLSDGGRVLVTNENDSLIILFWRGGGMFEFGPSYLYSLDNTIMPFEIYGDITCFRLLSPNWYDCS